MVRVKIEDTEYNLELDLGSNSDLMIKPRVLDQIQDKQLGKPSVWHDIKGNEYHSPSYKIPVLKIGPLRVENATAVEESEFLITTGNKIGKSDWERIQNQLAHIDGRIGSATFHSSVVFLDLSQPLFLLEATIEDMKTKISFEGFVEGSFDFERGLVGVNFMSESSVKKLLLDTGASISLANSSLNQRKIKMNHLELNSVDLGGWDFYPLEFPEKLSWADGILGMDFFNKFAVCLDFPNKKIYLKRIHTNFFFF